MTLRFAAILLFSGSSLLAQSDWSWEGRVEVRSALRESNEQRLPLRFPFDPIMLPPGQSQGFMETVDSGSHAELNLISLRFDLFRGEIFQFRAKVDALDLYDRNPTSGDRTVDGDEVWVRLGRRPEGLDLPEGTSWFVQAGKWPKFEKQPELLLESYGLASNAFSRFEDIGVLIGGTAGRHFYWRAQVTNGNPLFFRDSNALAGDNGIEELRAPNPDPELKSGFPILYDAEVEGWTFDFEEPEIGGGIGYRFSSDSGDGIDALLFHYERTLQPEVELHGTFYGGDLDLLDGTGGFSLPIEGDEKVETGARLYGRWKGLTGIAHYVEQETAGLLRDGTELELGWTIPLGWGVTSSGLAWLESIQPAVRLSELDAHFRGPPEFPAPSVWWDWRKIDVGLRLVVLRDLLVTIEHASHEVDIPADPDLDETLVSFTWRRGWTGGF